MSRVVFVLDTEVGGERKSITLRHKDGNMEVHVECPLVRSPN